MNLLVTALHHLGITGAAAQAVEASVGPPRLVHAGEPLVAEGDASVGVHIVLSGVLKSCRSLDNGLAQTLGLFIGGEAAGLQGVALGHETATLSAVSASRVALMPGAQVRALAAADPLVSAGLWRAMSRQAAVMQEWMVGMGRRTAHAQVAHLLCEIAVRMHAAGQANGNRYDFPLTQTELADAVGLSPVHVNRVLQNLRAKGLIQLSRGQLYIADWRRMARTADFDPTYLGLATFWEASHALVLLSSGDPTGAGDRRDRGVLPER